MHLLSWYMCVSSSVGVMIMAMTAGCAPAPIKTPAALGLMSVYTLTMGLGFAFLVDSFRTYPDTSMTSCAKFIAGGYLMRVATSTEAEELLERSFTPKEVIKLLHGNYSGRYVGLFFWV